MRRAHCDGVSAWLCLPQGEEGPSPLGHFSKKSLTSLELMATCPMGGTLWFFLSFFLGFFPCVAMGCAAVGSHLYEFLKEKVVNPRSLCLSPGEMTALSTSRVKRWNKIIVSPETHPVLQEGLLALASSCSHTRCCRGSVPCSFKRRGNHPKQLS